MHVICLANFYREYNFNYEVAELSREVDFEKVHQYFRDKIPYFDLYLRCEDMEFPKTIEELNKFIEFLFYRFMHPVFNQIDSESFAGFYGRFPEIKAFYDENLNLINADPKTNEVPVIFKHYSLAALNDPELIDKNASVTFMAAMPEMIQTLDIVDMFRYAQV